ncbi:MAG: hypothetical protein U0264_08550 [Candidatus Kapaibacterium sp.]
MKTSETLSIIEGNFTPGEANEILSQMISSKINFHNLRNLSSQERYGKDDEISHIRIPALWKEMEKLQAIVSEAYRNGKRLAVTSAIQIVLTDEKGLPTGELLTAMQ